MTYDQDRTDFEKISRQSTIEEKVTLYERP